MLTLVEGRAGVAALTLALSHPALAIPGPAEDWPRAGMMGGISPLGCISEIALSLSVRR